MDVSEKNLVDMIKAGRIFLHMTQDELAHAIGMEVHKIKRAETLSNKSIEVLLQIKAEMEKLGVVFLQSGRGVELVNSYYQVIEGSGCYVKLLDKILRMLPRVENKELLIMGASDRVSPPEVNHRYRHLRESGVTMRQIISADDSYILGPLHEYRGQEPEYFSNLVTVVFSNIVATVAGGEARIIMQFDDDLSEERRKLFSYLWKNGIQPKETIAIERF